MRLALRHGMCLLDDQDWPKLEEWVWHSRLSTVRNTGGRPAKTAYALGRLPGSDAGDLEMHRLILDLPPYHELHIDVDHRNGNGLDNRRENLRITTRSENLANTDGRGGTSQFKGVSYDLRTHRWKAQITVDGRNRNLGRYDTEDQAALAYNLAATDAWGEYARLNVVGPSVVLPTGTRGSSRFRGVTWDAKRQLWLAQIAVGGRHRYLGRHATEIEAAIAYNAAALEALGEKARLNTIPEEHG